MGFFSELYNNIDGIDVTMSFKRKNGKITVSVLPKTTSSIAPALITGTPEELDAEFFDAIKVPLEEAKGLNVELDSLKQSVSHAKKEAKEDAEEDGKQVDKSNATPRKKNADKVKKSDTKKVIEPSLF